MMQSQPFPTRRQLARMSDTELAELSRSLGQYLDTPQEREDRLLNNAIHDERARRNGYGFKKDE